MYPVSRLRGYYTLSATNLYLTFLPMHESRNRGGDVLDSVFINIGSGKGPDVIEAINREMSSGESHFIVIGDDVTSDYLTSDITSVGTIDVTSETT
jgi:hypothetical protein